MIDRLKEGRPRAGKKWTIDEQLVVIADTGFIANREIARRVGRSVKAVQGFQNREGISPYDHDGRYTPAEVARQINLPYPTLIDWLRKGQIEGVKVGSFWRIDWDGESKIVPRWNGKSLHKQDSEVNKGLRRECLNCGEQLILNGKRKADIWCTKKCRGAYTKKLYQEKIRETENK